MSKFFDGLRYKLNQLQIDDPDAGNYGDGPEFSDDDEDGAGLILAKTDPAMELHATADAKEEGAQKETFPRAKWDAEQDLKDILDMIPEEFQHPRR